MGSSSSHIVVPEGVIIREVAGEAVILNLNNEQYYGLDDIGTRMWMVLTTSASIQNAIDMLVSEFDVDPKILEHDVHTLIAELSEQGLIKIHES